MNIEQLKKAADALRESSDFRFGDPTTFSITLAEHEVELPGPADPAKYLDLLKRKLKVEVQEGDSVAVVCPGNGGLVAEALRAGAARVIAIEPRPRFHAAINRVCAMLTGADEEAEIKTHLGWPGDKTDIGPFDLVIWPEGLDECRDPATVLESLAGMVRAEPKGMMCVEVTHGGHTRVEPPLNAFLPTLETWWGVLDDIGGEVLETPGRATGRMIYRVADDAEARPEKGPAPKPEKKASPKKEPPAKKAPAQAPAPKQEKKAKEEPKARPPAPPPPAPAPIPVEKPKPAAAQLDRPTAAPKLRSKPTAKPEPRKPATDSGE